MAVVLAVPTTARKPMPISRARDQRLDPRRPHLLARAELSRRQGWGPEGFAHHAARCNHGQTAALRTKQIDGMIVRGQCRLPAGRGEIGRVLVQFGDLIKTFHIYVLYGTPSSQ